jgi:hypothetical protein
MREFWRLVIIDTEGGFSIRLDAFMMKFRAPPVTARRPAGRESSRDDQYCTGESL